MSPVVDITGLAYGGSGIGRIDGKVVFVPFTAPGDKAEVCITSGKKGYSEGVLKGLITPSPARVEPACPLFGRCGGCAWQHMSYGVQVRRKESILEETLRRIGNIKDVSFDPAVPSPDEFAYRSRARFQVDGGRIGFFENKSKRVVDIDACPVLAPLINDAYAGIRALSGGVAGLQSLEIGVSASDNRAVAVFSLAKNARLDWSGFFDMAPCLKGIEAWVSPSGKRGGRKVFEEGDTRLLYEAAGIRYEVPASSFSQANLSVNRLIIGKVIEYAALSGAETVLDLFSGSGNLTLPLARLSKEAAGIESDKDAAGSALKNAALNSIGNASFIAASSGAWLNGNFKNLEKKGVDVVILDPPRGGDSDVAEILARLRPSKVIYVSCSPPTLARDLSILARSGYKRFRASLFDMFPQTYHIEAVAMAQI